MTVTIPARLMALTSVLVAAEKGESPLTAEATRVGRFSALVAGAGMTSIELEAFLASEGIRCAPGHVPTRHESCVLVLECFGLA